MSQSDYIKYKKVTNELSIAGKQPPVFNSSDYTDFVEYTLENTVTNTKPIFNRMTPTGKQTVFGMYKTVTACPPTFSVCSRNDLRANRVPMSSAYFTPTPQPLSWKKTKNASNLKTACVCKLHRSYTGYRACNCKTSV